MPKGLDLDAVFRLEETRTISNDGVVSYQGRLLQIRSHRRHYAPARGKVTGCEWQDGRIRIYDREQRVEGEEIQQRPSAAQPVVAKKSVPHPPTKPAPHHPWKQKFQDMRVRRSPAVTRPS